VSGASGNITIRLNSNLHSVTATGGSSGTNGGGAGIGVGGSGSMGMVGAAGPITIVTVAGANVTPTGGLGVGGFSGADIGWGSNPTTGGATVIPGNTITERTVTITRIPPTGGAVYSQPSGSGSGSYPVPHGANQSVTITPNAGYTLHALTTTDKTDDAPIAFWTITNITADANLTAYFVPLANVMDTAAITVTEPVTGDPQDKAADGDCDIAAGVNFTCSLVDWTPDDDPFEIGKQYTATVTLAADAGFAFDATFTATINGQPATVTHNANGTVTLSYQFAATAAVVIANANIDVTAPVTGNPQDAVAGGDCVGGANFTCGLVGWTPSHNPFRGNTQYTTTVILTADANFAFDAAFTATINGQPATVTPNADGTVTLSYQFAATLAAMDGLASIPMLNPAMLVLLALALGGMAFWRRRKV
jgi:hypothetical protein